MFNPIKAYRQWREERKNARLREVSLTLANKYGGYMYETLCRAHTYYLYLKYGVDKDGVEVDEIFKRVDDEINRPYRPIKL